MNSDEQFEIYSDNAMRIMLAELQANAQSSDVSRTLARLIERIRLSVGSLTRLCKNNPNSPEIDGVSILRTIYEAHLQVLYILKDPDARTKLYNDFYWIDWRKFTQVVVSQPGKMFEKLAASKKRQTEEPQMLEEYRKVEATFRRGEKGHRRDWYEGTLQDVAKEVGYEGEYLVLSRLINPTMHSSAFGLRTNSGMSANTMTYSAWQFLHRCMGRIIEHEGLTGNLPQEIVDHFITPNYAAVFHVDDSMLEFLRDEEDENQT